MTSSTPIYLDHHATTPCDPQVIEAMLPTFGEIFGNAASRQHAYGWQAEALVERAREQVAELIGAHPVEIIFTSGATESNNLAIKGLARRREGRDRHVITSAIEHKAVLDVCGRLEGDGFEVTRLPVDAEGLIRPEAVEAAIRPQTFLVSLMHANNEIGVVNPIEAVGRICKRRKILFHCDAAQSLAYLPCPVETYGIDLLSISGHKMYGPKGVGALYVRRRNPRVSLEPLIYGGGHERGLRSGTLNVPGIVGLGAACELIGRRRPADAERLANLRDRLLARLREGLPELIVHGCLEHRLPNNLNVSFPGVDGDALLTSLREIAVSSGAACASATREPSHVLRALGVADDLIQASLRFGLGRSNTEAEIDRAAEVTIAAVRNLRAAAEVRGALSS